MTVTANDRRTGADSAASRAFSALNSYFDHVYIITIERNEDRHDGLKSDLHGLDYELFYGVDGRNLSDEEIARCYDDEATFRNYGSSLSPGQLGCTLSHLEVYRDLLDREFERVLILEDDATPTAGLANATDDVLAQLPDHWDLLYLYTPGGADEGLWLDLKVRFAYPVLSFFGFERYDFENILTAHSTPYAANLRYGGKSWSTVAYAVKAATAEQLLAEQDPVHTICDAALREFSAYPETNVFRAVPNLFEQKANVGSSIWDRPPKEETTHLAHVLPWKNVGGTEIATLRLINAADSLGYWNTAFHPHGAHDVRRLFAREGIRTKAYQNITPSYRSAWRYLSDSRELADTFRNQGIDAVHCADLKAAFQAGLAGKLAGIPVICHVRNRYHDLSLRDRSFLWTVDHFVFVSKKTWQTFAHRVPEDCGSVLYDGIGPPPAVPEERKDELKQEFDIPETAPVVGMVARVARQKDYETLAQAAEKVLKRAPDTHFVIVGDYEELQHADYYREICRLLQDLGIFDHFVFTGHRKDVNSLLAMFDVFVLSTHWEGFPLVILEAMSHGLPVVATEVDGIPEIVKHGSTGLLFPEGDSSALAENLLSLLGNSSYRERLRRQAEKKVRREFSHSTFDESVRGLYRRVLG